ASALGARRQACAGDRALSTRPRPRLLPWAHAHHSARLFRASFLCPVAAARLSALARARSGELAKTSPHHRHCRDRPAREHLGHGVAALRRDARIAPRGAAGTGADAPLPRIQGAVRLCRCRPTGWWDPESGGIGLGSARARSGGGGRHSQRRKRARGRAARGLRAYRDRSGSIEAGAAIIAAGAWVKSLLPALAAPLRITREVMAWFEPIDAQLSRPGRLPVFMIESRHGLHYGI